MGSFLPGSGRWRPKYR